MAGNIASEKYKEMIMVYTIHFFLPGMLLLQLFEIRLFRDLNIEAFTLSAFSRLHTFSLRLDWVWLTARLNGAQSRSYTNMTNIVLSSRLDRLCIYFCLQPLWTNKLECWIFLLYILLYILPISTSVKKNEVLRGNC